MTSTALPNIEMPPSPQDEVTNPLSQPEPDLDDTPRPEVVVEDDVDVSKLESMVGDITMPIPVPEPVPEPLRVKEVMSYFLDIIPTC